MIVTALKVYVRANGEKINHALMFDKVMEMAEMLEEIRKMEMDGEYDKSLPKMVQELIEGGGNER
jgi:hypothetical protein